MTGQRGLPQDHGHDVAHRDTDRPRLCRRFGWRWLRRAEYVALPCKFIRRYLLYDRGRWFLAKFKVGDGGVNFGLLLLLPVSDNLCFTRVVFLLGARSFRAFFFRARVGCGRADSITFCLLLGKDFFRCLADQFDGRLAVVSQIELSDFTRA